MLTLEWQKGCYVFSTKISVIMINLPALQQKLLLAPTQATSYGPDS